MAFTKTRASLEAVQKIMGSLKQFEKKLDKLQEDVCYHGQTLNELKSMVYHLSSGTIENPDGKSDEIKRAPKKTTATAIQYDQAFSFEEPANTRRKQTVRPLPSKTQPKVTQNRVIAMPKNRMSNKASSPRVSPVKHSHKNLRPSKAEAPRKATTLRSQKTMKKHAS